MINDIHLFILIHLGATYSFISSFALVRCGLATSEHDDFTLGEMAVGVE
jgi:hypothetical protein